MKKFRKTGLKFLCFLLVLVTCLTVASKIFMPKWRNNKDAYMTATMANFYKQKSNSLDVLFLGDSSVYRAVNPILLWKEQEIVSYVYGSPAQRVWLSYYMLKEALQYQKPSVLVLEANELFSTDTTNAATYRKVLDNMKLGRVKLEAMNDPIFRFKLDGKLSLLFPIFEYHNRYNELTWDDVVYAFREDKEYNRKGYAINARFKAYSGKPNYMKEKLKKNVTISKKAMKYFNKIIDLCDENDIELVLLKVPNAAEWNDEKNETINTICHDKQITLLDLNKTMKFSQIDWKRDTSDKGIHLNLFGAEKVTREVGDFLLETYSFPQTTDQEIVDDYNRSYIQYKKDKKRSIEKMKQREQKIVNAQMQ